MSTKVRSGYRPVGDGRTAKPGDRSSAAEDDPVAVAGGIPAVVGDYTAAADRNPEEGAAGHTAAGEGNPGDAAGEDIAELRGLGADTRAVAVEDTPEDAAEEGEVHSLEAEAG
ncbi:hypothetical protein LPJ53_006418 [Coemansia erecta]|uniref:Uncharacterized protein n=1 Tax=Coemansia erecta TaxID=147472 RepID=A0A9W8CMN2_9FUNG|nr:hypothetical protein LPJ53_006418 [Coemansia erecta]